MLTVFVTALILQMPNEEWPLGAFDIVGEMTYAEAASAMSVKPPDPKHGFSELLKDTQKDIRNPVLWKALTDKAISTQNWATLYDFYTKNTPGKIGQPKDEYQDVSNARGYCLLVIESHLREVENSLNSSVREKLKKLVQNRGLYGSFGRVPKTSERIMSLTYWYGSPKEWREKIAALNGKINCRYYLQYAFAESFRFTSIPVDIKTGKPTGKTVEMEPDRSLKEFKKAHSLFPTKPTPCFKVAAMLSGSDPKTAKVYATKYLELENRDFKARWKSEASTFIKTGKWPMPERPR
jgi:hypothetical protein